MRDLPEELWHESYRHRDYRRVMDGTPVEKRGGAPAGLRRLRADEPSKAITGAAVNKFIHPIENRPLTIRVSSAGEFHPRALPEPDVSLSTHPAPIIPPPGGGGLSSVVGSSPDSRRG